MYRDLKLGLALAVLLIGSTAAFFFRGEVDPDAGLPTLQDPERVDGEVALRGAVPYLKQLEADDDAKPSPWSKPAFLGGTIATAVRRTVTPDPIQIVMEEESELLDTGPALPPPADALPSPADETGTRYHTVRPGDTLTGLAASYLGSLARYVEIYELNRDQLSGPDSLQVGMRLRLPGVNSAAAAAPEPPAPPPAKPDAVEPDAQPSQAIAAPDAAPSTPPAGKLFVPAKRSPFVPPRHRTPAADPSSAAL